MQIRIIYKYILSITYYNYGDDFNAFTYFFSIINTMVFESYNCVLIICYFIAMDFFF